MGNRNAKGDPFEVGRRPQKRKLSAAPNHQIDTWWEKSHIKVGALCDDRDKLQLVKRLCYTYRDIFALSLEDLPPTDLVEHNINLQASAQPVAVPPRRYSQRHIRHAAKIFPTMQMAGIIYAVSTTWGSRPNAQAALSTMKDGAGGSGTTTEDMNLNTDYKSSCARLEQRIAEDDKHQACWACRTSSPYTPECSMVTAPALPSAWIRPTSALSSSKPPQHLCNMLQAWANRRGERLGGGGRRRSSRRTNLRSGSWCRCSRCR
ncbi:hypothetical protein QBC46DRAFT_93386 [Diplogelasinospora grovesii]|uniref:Uncharacterized protein n=1 Tax=Diplogelasinospora grovesii TaxID=303347 RepID=A0AAN6NGP8_9PEZI|nr:hypothetical protein QBC46DRAFT_93386 [Diplogelasinospora grovesii]